MSLSVAIITKNEEANLRRTLESVKWADEIVVVDSGSTDRTCEIAREYGAKVFVEEWKGFAKQKNSAIEKCTGDWILSLDADEEPTPELGKKIVWAINPVNVVRYENEDGQVIETGDEIPGDVVALGVQRANYFLGKWIKHGGFWPDEKLRVFRRSACKFNPLLVHETIELPVWGRSISLNERVIHHAYPTLSGYIEHMNRYSDLGAEMVVEKKGKVGFSFMNIVLRPITTFLYNYFFRLGFLDGREGLLLHLYHSVYVSWKYAKAWELSRKKE